MNLYHRAIDGLESEFDSENTAPALEDRDDTIDESVEGAEGGDGGDLSKRATSKSKGYRQLTCNDCNRKFCLNYELPTCKGAKEEDVVTTCFREFFYFLFFFHSFFICVCVWLIGIWCGVRRIPYFAHRILRVEYMKIDISSRMQYELVLTIER